MKKFIRILAALVFTVTVLSTTALAASSVWNTINRANIVTYPVKASGRIYGYTDSTLTVQSGWIDCKNDECTIVDINSNGTAYKVRYPLDNGGKATRWFRSTDFTAFTAELASRPDPTYVWSRINVYKHAKGNASYGYTYSSNRNDPIYRLGFDLETMREQILYRTDNGTWKMGWVSYDAVN